MTTSDDPWDRVYKTTQAYNYEKREEAYITSTTKEEARKNADQLIESEEKAKLKERKEAKKKRQKERKKAEKAQNGKEEKKTSENSGTRSEGNVTARTNQSEVVEESEDESLECYDQEGQIDNEFLDINAAFVKVSVKHNKNIAPNKTSVSKPEKVSPPLDSMSTPMSKFMQSENTKSQSDTAEALGMESCSYALNNDFVRAINCLSQAISCAPEDVRHFLNRSYCHLRLGQYALALSDAQLANKKSQTMEHFAKAVAREGQALCGLQQYHEAEKCFEEILKSEEGNKWILTELVLARVLQLTNMGFSEIDALKALQQCPTVVDAVTLLTSGNISSPQSETNINNSADESCDGDEIYISDDESSNTIFLSKLVSATTDDPCFLENLRSQPLCSKIQEYSNSLDSTSKSSISTESLSQSNGNKSSESTQWETKSNFKSVPSTSSTQIKKPIISDSSSIWVGSVDKSITEHKLRELFGIYGKIKYIRRFSDERNYVFVDFESKKAATKALNDPKDFEINGVKLPVRPAPGNTGKK